MKKINNQFTASATDIKKANAHLRALSRKADYSGNIELFFNHSNGEFLYIENVGNGWTQNNDPDIELINSISF